jgi:hypothetical protein
MASPACSSSWIAAAAAGPHLRGIITDERRLSAERVCQILQGMRLLVVATVTADGRPLAGPVDGYFLHGSPRRRCSPSAPVMTEHHRVTGRVRPG